MITILEENVFQRNKSVFPLTYIKRQGNSVMNHPRVYTMQPFLPHYLTPAVCTKEQNDQIQESDAGASVGVSGQNWQCVTVCSICSAILFPGYWWHLVGSRETIIVPFYPARWRQEPSRRLLL